MNDNLKGRITELKSAAEGFGIQIYESMEMPLKKMAESGIESIGKLSEALNSGGFSGMAETIGSLMAQGIAKIAEYAPQVIQASTTIIQSFIQGISDNLPQIISSAGEIVSSLVNAMYSGNEIREYNEFKHAIVSAVNDNRVVVRSVEYPNENNAKSIVKEIKTVASNMEFPRTDYNRYAEIVKQKTGETVTPVTTWTDRNRKVIIMRTDVLESLSVEVLASAFNMSEADFRNNLVTVDTFDYDVVDYETRKITGRVKSDLMFVIADMSAFQIYDNLKKVAGDFLSSSLNWQLFLHIWQTIGICPFANFVAYTSSSNPELLGVSLSDYVAELTDVAPTKEIAYEFTPDNYIGGVKVNPLSITKDGVSVDISTADTVFPIVVNNDTKSFTINNKTGGEAGVYECKFTVSADTGALFPNAILSVSRTIS